MIDVSEFESEIIHRVVRPRREAVYRDFPEAMLPAIREFLEGKGGISRLYSHQAEMFESALAGNNVVITTSTASGKTLSFLLPILQEILKDPLTRALFVYPTKALAADQFRNFEPILRHFGKNRIQAGVYDGDTPVPERSRIRNSANIILTNPEMLSTAFLPHHSQHGFNFVFSNLKYVVVDELHTYRGAFGSHLSNLFKRLTRVCRYYHSAPRFLCSSATIANPLELAGNVCGRSFVLVDRDGSPAPEKHYYVWQPPIVASDYRVPPIEEAATLIPRLVAEGTTFIAFCRSRKAVEIVLKESRDRLRADGGGGSNGGGVDLSDKLAGYRGGYLPEERRDIERKMVGGQLKGLVSTNALELGIDIGSVEATILTGFPGTRASFWQQSGRAGRKGATSSTFLILDNLPFDQYIAIDPDWLFESTVENAVVDPGNLFIQLAHVRAAAAELPLSPDDMALFADLGEIVPVLLDAKELRSENGRFVWCGKEFPAGDFSLRNMDKTRFKLRSREDGALITEMDELQAFREIHPGAIYMHEGMSYQVEAFDPVGRTAEARPMDINYYTVPNEATTVERIAEGKGQPLGRTAQHFGDVRVTNTILGYKRLQFHNRQNLGYQELDMPLSKTFETEGLWVDLPREVADLFRRTKPHRADETPQETWKDYFYAIGYALLNAVLMATMTTTGDVGMARISDGTGPEPVDSVCIFDLYVGGLGFAEKAYDHTAEIVASALKLVANCQCRDGCPACVGDHRLDRSLVLWGLKSLYEELAPPANVKVPVEARQVFAAKRFALGELPERWPEFVAFLSTTGEYMTGFLKSVPSVRVERSSLVLRLPDAFTRDWVLKTENVTMMRNAIAHFVAVPADFRVDAEVGESAAEGAVRSMSDLEKRKSKEYKENPDVDVHGKLLRRMKDLGGKGV
jgi:DEAD/DEAH box helicase domain-containing protein